MYHLKNNIKVFKNMDGASVLGQDESADSPGHQVSGRIGGSPPPEPLQQLISKGRTISSGQGQYPLTISRPLSR